MTIPNPIRLCTSLLLLCLCASGCSNIKQISHETAFYMLEYPPATPSSDQPLPVTIRIKRFTVNPGYNTDRIVYRQDSYRRASYNYHRWHAHPAEMLRTFLQRDFIASRQYTAVIHDNSVLLPDYTLGGNVDALYEDDAPSGWQAVVSMTLYLVTAREPETGKQVLLQKTYRFRQPCTAQTPMAVVQAMSEAVRQLSAAIRRDVYTAIQGRRSE